ncbi:MAG TPA: hypoxanthine phosphoribosyltransferase [Acidimicrobiales bacterium]|nr:hypoxanthine phosphoribosyltransferase [Acidimicrobiales bacterium]
MGDGGPDPVLDLDFGHHIDPVHDPDPVLAPGLLPGPDHAELVADLLTRCTFPAPGTPLACAVSGGPDSLALLVLAVAAGCDVTALHVDHGLRAGSAGEADVVAAAAAKLGARFERRTVAVPPGSNLEARARAARFGVLPADVATGHTMDDQAETILVNLLRGAGADGLAGMAPGVRHPLLALRREETHRMCRAAGLVPVCDESNEDPAFVRNRVRHELLPLCAEVAGRDPVPLLARQAGVLRDEVALLDSLAAEALPDPADARRVAATPKPLARRALRNWLRADATAATGPTGPAGARGAAGARGPAGARGATEHPPSLAEVDRVLAVAAGDAVGTELSGGRRVRRSRGRLKVEAPRRSGSVTAVTEEAGTGVPTWAEPDVGPVLVGAGELAARVAELGAQITGDYADEPPLLVAVLKGAMLFLSDLCRAIELPVDVDFMAVSSYGSATKTSGVVRIVKDLDSEVLGRRVLVVEDIIDSGLTLNYLRKYLTARQPKSLEVCALLVKEGEQRVEIPLRYVGFTIPSVFVVGYGLDVGERYRNLRGVHGFKGTEQ